METIIKDKCLDNHSIDTKNITEKINNYLENHTNLTNQEYYDFLSFLYDFKLEDKDYIDYIKFKTGIKFDNIIKINTDVIDSYIEREGHGRDFSWWTVKVRLVLKVAVNTDLENKNYTVEEIKKLISQNKIYPIDYFYEECSDDLKENRIKNDIDYLIKNKEGKLDINCEYFDFIINNIRKEIEVDEIIKIIRSYIINLKMYLECYLIDCYYEETQIVEDEITLVDNLIDTYNKVITEKYKENNQNNSSNLYNKFVCKNAVEIVIDYVSKLSFINKDNWYKEISIEQIVNIIENIEYDKNKEICQKIENVVIELEEPELCSLLLEVPWINSNKMIDIVINSRDEETCYYLLKNHGRNLSRTHIKKLINIIIESNNNYLNYKIAQEEHLGVDVRRHGKVIIDCGDVWFNYLYASEIEGADIKKHGEVIINSKNVYYNYLFATNIKGADIDRHCEVVMLNDNENKYKSSLVKKKVK